jgi:glyoxylase-like metal-dependent hydrolase (beta-lactamase superfamily II)
MKLYFFDGGALTCDKSSITLNRGAGTLIDIPITFFLIQHPQGNMLYDTGLARECLEDPDKHWGIVAKSYQFKFSKEQYITERLATVGIKPDDIKYVVMSHLHMDHTGGLREFPKAKILVQRREMEWAYTADWYQKAAYVRADFDQKLKYEYIEGLEQNPYDVFGDGSVTVWRTPGHTPGHQSVLVKLPESGSFMLTQDAIYTSEILNKKVLPGVCWNNEEAVKSIKMIQHMRDNGVNIVCGHDIDEWKQWKKAPEYYA